MDSKKARESTLRRRLAKEGYSLRKSRKSICLDNFGDYMIIDTYKNYVVAGSRYDYTLDDVEDFLEDESL
jgi:hypothetical protein